MLYFFKLFFTKFAFLVIVFSLLFKHFTVANEPKLNLNFHKHSTITRIFSRTNYIEFYEKYFFKHEAIGNDLEKSHITLHSKKYVNLLLVKGPYTLCTDFYWIHTAVIGLLVTIFLRYTVKVFV